MDIETRLAGDLLEAHPLDAARASERLPARDVAALIGKMETAICEGILQHMAPPLAGAVLAELRLEKAAEILEKLPVEMAALSLRSMDSSLRTFDTDGIASGE